jgi:hypothetical protein
MMHLTFERWTQKLRGRGTKSIINQSRHAQCIV